MNSKENKIWGIQMCHSIEEMEDLLNHLQKTKQVIHEVNTRDMVVTYYKKEKKKKDKKRIDE